MRFVKKIWSCKRRSNEKGDSGRKRFNVLNEVFWAKFPVFLVSSGNYTQSKFREAKKKGNIRVRKHSSTICRYKRNQLLGTRSWRHQLPKGRSNEDESCGNWMHQSWWELAVTYATHRGHFRLYTKKMKSIILEIPRNKTWFRHTGIFNLYRQMWCIDHGHAMQIFPRSKTVKTIEQSIKKWFKVSAMTRNFAQRQRCWLHCQDRL